MKRFFSIAFLLTFSATVFAQPTGYYDPAAGKTGAELKTVLYNIIKGHTSISYDALYEAYKTTDNIIVSGSSNVYDMYSIKADGSANYYYSHQTKTCGNYSSEGDCYNREHSMPQSWFNSSSPMVSDLFHVYPTDGKVNGMRSNYPFGKVGSVTYTSTNGSKLGSSDPATGYTGTVFEPIDEYKGDFARTYFYMATRYENVIASWASNGSAGQILDGTAFPVFKIWYKNLMLQWNQQDPVSPKEITRNDAAYAIQHNRNPYIDHPEYAEAVWGNGTVALSFISSPVTSTTINQIYSYSVKVAGPTGKTFIITAPTKPTWLSLTNGSNGFATLSGTPTSTNLGNNHVVLSLTDGTNTVQQDFMISVLAALPLGISSTPITDVMQGVEYIYNISAQGPAGTIYTITCPTKPAWLTYQSISNGIAKLSGVPAISDIGDHDIKLSVNDGISTVNQEFTITVAENTIVPGGTETFTNITTGSSSYSNISWTGDDGTNWSATLARTDLTSNGPAVCLKNTANTAVQSGSLSGGCGTMSFKTLQAYSGTGGTLTLYINDIQTGSPFAYTTTEQVATFSDVNVAGVFVIKLVNNGNARPIIDDITWTGYNPSENILPTLTNVSNSPLEPTTGQSVTISANIIDSDGTIQEAYVKWGRTSSSLTNQAVMTLVGAEYEAIIPAQSQPGTIYLSVNAKDNSNGVTTILMNYTVTQSNQAPVISNFSCVPQEPTTSQSVVVSATITDSDGTIQEAWVNWGDALNNQPNRIDLVYTSGKYETTIPAQAQAGIVYFSVNANDNLSATSSNQFNYSVTPATYDGYEVNSSKVKIYPNPAKNQITVEVVGLINNVTVSNIIGEKAIIMAYCGSKQIIDISKLKPGIYFVSLTGDEFKSTTRIIIY